jgi:hypothetical protein
MRDTEKQVGWKVVSYGVGALAAVVAQRVLTLAWKGIASDPPPDSPANRDVDLLPALTWAIATGVGIGVTRLLALRTAAKVWEVAAKEAPPIAA